MTLNPFRAAILVLAALALGAVPACKTDDPGVRSSYRSQWRNIDADTEAATEAAREVLEELDLRDVEATSTAVDGQAVGYTADGTRVTVSVARVTDQTSEVSVNVGTLGDPDLGGEVLRRIQQRIDE